MPEFIYFAYGSNMLTERLRRRCPGANPFAVAAASNHRLCFSKHSKKDGSGKATLVAAQTEVAHGVLFAIPQSERVPLEEAEGTGYRLEEEFVVINDKKEISAVTYLAKECDDKQVPYDLV